MTEPQAKELYVDKKLQFAEYMAVHCPQAYDMWDAGQGDTVDWAMVQLPLVSDRPPPRGEMEPPDDRSTRIGRRGKTGEEA